MKNENLQEAEAKGGKAQCPHTSEHLPDVARRHFWLCLGSP